MKNIILFITILMVVFFSSACSRGGDNNNDISKKEIKIIFQSVREAPLASADYQANHEKYWELYTMKQDGSKIKRITNNQYWENQPYVSPDSQKILFSLHKSPPPGTEDTDPGWEIATMDIDGKNLKNLTNNNYFDFGGHWNHDGNQIVFISDTAKRDAQKVKRVPMQYDLYVMNIDGTEKKKLTSAKPGEVYADPSFSYNEPSKIIYIYIPRGSASWDLYMMNTDGSNKKQIFKHGKEILAIHDPMFSPDDQTIIFGGVVGKDSFGNQITDIFTVGVDGKNLKRITKNDKESDYYPHFSPDGKKISYGSWVWESLGVATITINTAELDGSNKKKISKFPWEAAPTWVSN